MAKRRYATITGVGSCLPERVLTNYDLENMVDTTDEWIRTRTGIRERRIVDDGTATSDLAVVAAERALAEAGVDPADLDLILVATVTPDMPFPATACIVQERIGAHRAAAFDLEAACSGFVFGMAIAAQFIETGLYKRVLVIGAETMSKVVDWTDRRTCILVGDGAGAVVMESTDSEGGILGLHLGADGSGAELLSQPAGGSRLPASKETVEERLHFMKMNGREVFKFAVRAMGEAAQGALAQCNLSLEDVDFYVPHQANYRIIESSARRFGLPMDRVYVNIDRYGNMSSASIPVALDEALNEGLIKPGHLVLLVAFGGGLTWGAAAVRWTLERKTN